MTASNKRMYVRVDLTHPVVGSFGFLVNARSLTELAIKMGLAKGSTVTLSGDDVIVNASDGQSAIVGTVVPDVDVPSSKARRVSILTVNMTVEEMAKHIVMDSFKTVRVNPEMEVDTNLPIPMVRNSRRRIAKSLRLHMDHEFHSMYDRAVNEISKQTTE